MNCNNYFDMTDQGDSFETWQGLRGPAGPQGPAGAPGAPGTSVKLRGPVASTSELPASAPSSELWMVGEESPYDGYFWNGLEWINAGQLMQGPQGEPGEDGVSPEVTIAAITGGHAVTITDADHPSGQTFNIMDGADGTDGTDGTDGVTFTPTVSSAGVISWTNDGGLPNPESVNIKGPAGQDGTDGQDGAPGAAAGFGAPTATVDGNVGTPSVTVTASGPDTAKVFAFAFSNLKGEPGVTPTVPTAYTSNPEMDSTASPGSSANYARGDHVHPTDTSRLSASGDGSNVRAAFSAASSRTNISTGEKLSVLFGKIAKWFADIGTAAFRAATSSIAQDSTDLIESGAVYTGLAEKTPKSDLAPISITGTTNNTGADITIGTYFYLNGALAFAKQNIANGATLTSGTNYDVVSTGGLNPTVNTIPGTFNAYINTSIGYTLMTYVVGHVAIVNGVFFPNADISMGATIGNINCSLQFGIFFNTCGSNGQQFPSRGQISNNGDIIIECNTALAGGYYSFTAIGIV